MFDALYYALTYPTWWWTAYRITHDAVTLGSMLSVGAILMIQTNEVRCMRFADKMRELREMGFRVHSISEREGYERRFTRAPRVYEMNFIKHPVDDYAIPALLVKE